MDHVLVGALHHHLSVVRVLDTVQLIFRCCQSMGLAAGVILDCRLIAFSLLKLTLHSRKKVMSESAKIRINKFMLVWESHVPF